MADLEKLRGRLTGGAGPDVLKDGARLGLGDPIATGLGKRRLMARDEVARHGDAPAVDLGERAVERRADLAFSEAAHVVAS